MLNQISVYTENKKGAAKTIFSLLAKKDINVFSLVNSDSGEFGTMRIIVSDTDAAIEELKGNGYLCKVDKVIASELEDKPGSLESFLTHIETININISYMYVGYMRESKAPVIILRCEDSDIVESNLIRNGYKTY